MSQVCTHSVRPTHFIEAQPLGLPTPCPLLEEVVQFLRSIAKSCEILPQDNHHVRTDLLCLGDELHLAQTPSPSLIVARHDNLLLLDRQGLGLESRILGLKHRGIKAIIVLSNLSVAALVLIIGLRVVQSG